MTTLGTPITAIAQAVQQGTVQSAPIQAPDGVSQIAVSALMDSSSLRAGLGNSIELGIYSSPDGVNLTYVGGSGWNDVPFTLPDGWPDNPPGDIIPVPTPAAFYVVTLTIPAAFSVGASLTFS
jgi:hypothetical protein